ncbi:MAG: response regulator [Candidatus Kapaibacterium sp.]
MESNSIYFIIADDEHVVRESLKKLIAKAFPEALIYEAANGIECFDILKKIETRAIVVSDLNMPELNGLQLLKKIRSDENLKDTYFIIITSSTDKDTNLKAMQQGADDFVGKPFSMDQLIGRLRTAVRLIKANYEIKNREAEIEDLQNQLENDVYDLLLKIQTPRIENSDKFLEMVSDAALWISKELDETDKKNLMEIQRASKLAFIGKLFLDDKALKDPVTKDGIIINKQLKKIPEYSKDLIGNIKGYEKTADILYHLYENFDGSGHPEKIKSWQIPVESRIIRVCLDFFDMIEAKGYQSGKAMEFLEHESRRLYDYRIVALLDQYLANSPIGARHGREYPVLKKELEVGMTISRNIITHSGLKIISSGTILNEERIEKIRSITKSDPVIGKIYVS